MTERRRKNRASSQNPDIALEELVFGNRLVAEDGKVVVSFGGGCLSVFGAIFFMFGCGVIVLGLQDVKDETYIILPFAGLFALAGLMLVIWRYRLEIDGNARTYRRGFKLLINIVTKRGSLDDFDEVVLTRKVSRSGGRGNRTATLNVIQLSGPQGILVVASRGDRGLARRAAKQVAKELNLPFSESSGE